MIYRLFYFSIYIVLLNENLQIVHIVEKKHILYYFNFPSILFQLCFYHYFVVNDTTSFNDHTKRNKSETWEFYNIFCLFLHYSQIRFKLDLNCITIVCLKSATLYGLRDIYTNTYKTNTFTALYGLFVYRIWAKVLKNKIKDRYQWEKNVKYFRLVIVRQLYEIFLFFCFIKEASMFISNKVLVMRANIKLWLIVFMQIEFYFFFLTPSNGVTDNSLSNTTLMALPKSN